MDTSEPAVPAPKVKHYWKAVGPFKEILHKTISPEQLVALSEKDPRVHLAYAARQFAIVASAASSSTGNNPGGSRSP